MIYAYARVSTKEQNLDRQLAMLKEVYCDYIWQEKQSGKDFQRPIYQKMKKCLRKDDTLLICSLDRLGRNYDEIIEEWNYYKKAGVFIKVLDMPLLDTKNAINGLDGRFIADLVLQILSYVAQKEREKIKERQAQGIAIAKEKGVRFGRPKKDIDKVLFIQKAKEYQYHVYLEDGKAKAIKEDILKTFNISHGTFFRLLKEVN